MGWNDDLHEVPAARAVVELRLGFTVFVRGGLGRYAKELEDLVRWLLIQPFGRDMRFVRCGSSIQWRSAREELGSLPIDEVFGVDFAAGRSWVGELSNTDRPDPSAGRMELADLHPAEGCERLSYLQFQFASNAEVSDLVAIAHALLGRIPFWWATGGWVFHHLSGPAYTAGFDMAAQAKRRWCVQILDLPSLQWDGLLGMPAVNWLTLVGPEFAQSVGVQLDAIEAAGLSGHVYIRRGQHGLALAAGGRPIQGDINLDEDFSAYVRVTELLQPFLLQAHRPLSGPFTKSDILSSWLHRFSDPNAWLACDIHAG